MIPFLSAVLSSLAGPVTDAALSAFKKAQEAKMSEAAMRAEVKRAIEQRIQEVATTELESKRDVLLADLEGNWFQRSWRAMMATLAFLSYWYVVIVIPHLVAWGWMAAPRFGEKGLANLFWLTVLAMSGYLIGESGIAARIGNRRRGG